MFDVMKERKVRSVIDALGSCGQVAKTEGCTQHSDDT